MTTDIAQLSWRAVVGYDFANDDRMDAIAHSFYAARAEENWNKRRNQFEQASTLNAAVLMVGVGMPRERVLEAMDFKSIETGNALPKCPYCNNTGTHTNLRGGEECAGCSAPR
jgi:hypothetical protein